jgi:drug/metabolite transporter (DMT)-like permease
LAESKSPFAAAKTRFRISDNLLPYLALLGGVMALSLSSIFIRWASAPGMVTSFYRMLFASLLLLPFFLRITRGPKARPLAWNMIWLPMLGGLMTAMDHAVWSTSMAYTKVANATLLNNISPLWVALVTWLFWKERLSRRFWIGLALTLVGAGIVFSHDLLTNPQLGKGDLLALFSSLFYAGYFLFTQRGREHFQTIPYMYLVIVTSVFVLLGTNLLAGNPLVGYPTRDYLLFLAVAIISQIGGYFALSYALGHLSAAVVSPTMIGQPILTAMLAIPLVGEALLPAQWIGGLVVLTGIYLVNRR